MQEETQEVNSTGTQDVVLPMDKGRASTEAQSKGGLQSQGKPELSQHDTLMLEQKACPSLSCQVLKKAPEALEKRGNHSQPMPVALLSHC